MYFGRLTKNCLGTYTSGYRFFTAIITQVSRYFANMIHLYFTNAIVTLSTINGNLTATIAISFTQDHPFPLTELHFA